MIKNGLFKRIFLYIGLESMLYQAILCIHQIMLFKYSDPILYGLAGTLFSGIFLMALYCNFGLDASLPSIFKSASQCKTLFRTMILKQLLGILIIPFILSGIYFFYPQEAVLTVPLRILIVCGILIVIESAKKTVRTLLYLALRQKNVAFVEIATLSLYVATIQAYIFTYQSINLYAIFVPMLLYSGLALCIYLFLLRTYYNNLPEEPAPISYSKPFASMRFKNWSHQVLHSLYSSNFLIFSIAHLYGLELAALLKVISFCIYNINYIVQHTFGIAGSVLFAHITDRPIAEKQHFFSMVRSRLTYILLALPIVLLGYYWYLHIAYPHLSAEYMHIISLFMILLFSENIAIAHEQFYIVENRTGLLIACNIATLIPWIVHYYMQTNSPIVCLYLLIIARMSIFLFLHYVDKLSYMYTYIMQQKYRLLFIEK